MNDRVNVRKVETLFIILSLCTATLYSYIFALLSTRLVRQIYDMLDVEWEGRYIVFIWGVIYIGALAFLYKNFRVRGYKIVVLNEKMSEEEKTKQFIDIAKDNSNNKVLSRIQKNIVLKTAKKGVNIDNLCNGKLSPEQMKEIILGEELGLDVSYYNNADFTVNQMRLIKDGLLLGLDVSMYADVKYNVFQMYEIKKGIMQGVDVTLYADENKSWEEMEDIRISLACDIIKKRDS